MKKYVNGKIIEMTEEEIAELKERVEKVAAEEFHRELTKDEVVNILIKSLVNTVEIADSTSVKMQNYYPTFESIVGQTVKLGFKFTYNGSLWKTVKENLLIQSQYIPGVGTESLYTKIDEEHVGNKHDPIPYSGNMALINGKHYVQNDTIYRCNRDTINPVYNDLTNLVGLYVDAVQNQNGKEQVSQT